MGNMDWTELGSLVAKIQSGQTEVWGELYEKITPYILSRTRYLLRNEADAEDATQETLIEIYKSISNLSDPQAFGGWLKTITIRKCYRYYKKPTKDVEESLPEDNEGLPIALDFIDDRQSTPVEEIEAQETKDNLRLMIETLPSVQRETMILFYYDNLKIREIATIMDCSENTVKSRLNYAKRTMEAEISEKRKKGILFPAIMPWHLIFRQLFSEAFEESTGDVGSEVLQRIGENVASELGGMGGTEGLGGTGSGGLEGTGGVGGSVGSGATTAKGLTVATKAILGIVAAVALAAAIILPNISKDTQEPVTDSDYAHIYYDYIQNELIPSDNYEFIDADMQRLYGSEYPVLIVSNGMIPSSPESDGQSYQVYKYDHEHHMVMRISTHGYTNAPNTLGGQYQSILIEFDGEIKVADIVAGISLPENMAYGQIRISSDLSSEHIEMRYSPTPYPEDYVPTFEVISLEEYQELIDSQVGSWSLVMEDEVCFEVAYENTNGERLRDYFDD